MSAKSKVMRPPKYDKDIAVLKACCFALKRSTTPKMLKANLDFLYDRFILNPPSKP